MKSRQASVLCRAGMVLTVLAWCGCSEGTKSPVAPTPVTHSPGVSGAVGSPETLGAQRDGSRGLVVTSTPWLDRQAGAPGSPRVDFDNGFGASTTPAVALQGAPGVEATLNAQFVGLGPSEAPVVGFGGAGGAPGTPSALCEEHQVLSEPVSAQSNHDSETGAGNGQVELKSDAPTPQEPVGGVQITDTNPVLTASNARGLFVEATFEHEFAVYEVGGSGLTQVEVGRGVPEGNGTTSYPVTRKLDLGASYVWRARAFLDGAYGPWSNDASFETAAILLGVPEPVAPKDATVGVDISFTVRNPTVEGRVTGAVRIEIQVATDAEFVSNVMTGRADADGRGRTVVSLRGSLEPSTPYHWRARAKATAAGAGDVTSAWSDSVMFRTAAVTLTPPRPLSPRNGAMDVSITTCPTRMFTVRDATLQGGSGRVSIQLQVARDQAFTNIVARFETNQRGRGETNLCVDVELARGTQYFWRVRAQLTGSALESDWSAAWSFTTAERSRPQTGSPQGDCCPPPNRFEVVQAVIGATGNLYRQDIDQFTQRVAECLAAEDGDWGRRLNDSGAIGFDIVAYRTNRGPGHGPYSIDIMLGGGGPDPRPHWSVVTHEGVQGRVGGTWLAVNGADCVLP